MRDYWRAKLWSNDPVVFVVIRLANDVITIFLYTNYFICSCCMLDEAYFGLKNFIWRPHRQL